jgi:hypothetical protein
MYSFICPQPMCWWCAKQGAHRNRQCVTHQLFRPDQTAATKRIGQERSSKSISLFKCGAIFNILMYT